jgi:hypothetical protein
MDSSHPAPHPVNIGFFSTPETGIMAPGSYSSDPNRISSQNDRGIVSATDISDSRKRSPAAGRHIHCIGGTGATIYIPIRALKIKGSEITLRRQREKWVREQRLEKSQSSALMASSSIQYKANYA